jgi:hypothetical protein
MAQRNDGGYRPGSPEGWDGRAGGRVVAALLGEPDELASARS